MDSRTSVELIFDQGLGDVFSARVAGNVINDDILGSMEYACKLAGSKVDCGAGPFALRRNQRCLRKCRARSFKRTIAQNKTGCGCGAHRRVVKIAADDDSLVQKVADKNVQLTVEQIRSKSSLLDAMVKSGEIGIVGAMYDIETGKVKFYPEEYKKCSDSGEVYDEPRVAVGGR